MNHTDFLVLLKKVQEETVGLLESKGHEYAGSHDRLANFKRGAEDLGIKPTSILWVYFKKHIDSLSTFVRTIEQGGTPRLSEPIEGRINDAINYLILLRGLIEDGQLGKPTEPEAWVEVLLGSGAQVVFTGVEGAYQLKLCAQHSPGSTQMYQHMGVPQPIIAWRASQSAPWTHINWS